MRAIWCGGWGRFIASRSRSRFSALRHCERERSNPGLFKRDYLRCRRSALDCRVVLRDGREQTLTLDAQAALAFATQAAQRFGIPDLAPICATFEKERLQQAKPAKEKLAKAK